MLENMLGWENGTKSLFFFISASYHARLSVLSKGWQGKVDSVTRYITGAQMRF